MLPYKARGYPQNWTGNTMYGDGIHFLSFHNYICKIQQIIQ